MENNVNYGWINAKTSKNAIKKLFDFLKKRNNMDKENEISLDQITQFSWTK